MVFMPILTSCLRGIFHTISVCVASSSSTLLSWLSCTWGTRLWYLCNHGVGSKVCYRCWHTLRATTHAQMTHTYRYCIAQIKKIVTPLLGGPQGRRRNKPHSHTLKVTEMPFHMISHWQFSSTWFYIVWIYSLLYSFFHSFLVLWCFWPDGGFNVNRSYS